MSREISDDCGKSAYQCCSGRNDDPSKSATVPHLLARNILLPRFGIKTLDALNDGHIFVLFWRLAWNPSAKTGAINRLI
jgi:hypothetical protein